ncbi:hypothetical protein D3C72_1706950 [compost metagenome]
MPLTSITAPANRKNGIASSTKWSTPAVTCWAKKTNGSDGSLRKNTIADIPRVKAIGTPEIMPRIKQASINAAGSELSPVPVCKLR